MPVQRCQSGGRPGFKYGKTGKCYIYTKGDTATRSQARALAAKQGRAIEHSKAERS